MSKQPTSTKDVLKAHSKAKVELYTQYLSTYLSILGNTPHVSQVHLFDVLCGEGKYADNAEGSALRGLRTVLAYQKSIPASRLKVAITLNDGGKSDVERGFKKIERVEKYAQGIPLDFTKSSVKYSALDYYEILKKTDQQVNQLETDERALVFIDPWGYKTIEPQKLLQLLKSGRSEILLFLPVAHMYRFANAAMANEVGKKVLKCMIPLKFLLKELFSDQVPHFVSFDKFFIALRDKLESALQARFTGDFILQSPGSNKYALFFFTSNLKGLDVFVQSCWKVDSAGGRGHFNKKPTTLPLFPREVQHIQEVLDFIQFKGEPTNHDLYEFGLTRTMLTRMTNEVLNTLRERGLILASSCDGKPEPRKGANYLGYKHERKISFKLL